jgi:regulatory protein
MAGKITSLEVQKKNKERVNVYLDSEFAFGLAVNESLHLKKGQFLTDEEVERLKQKDDLHQAYNRSLYFLGFRARSRKEMERYLHKKGFEPAVVNQTITRLENEKYVDDRAFAVAWVENRQLLKPKSQRALSYELRQKGIDRAVIEDILDVVDEALAAEQALAGRLRNWQSLDEPTFRKKAVGFLSRRGFSYDVVRVTVDQGWEQQMQQQETED